MNKFLLKSVALSLLAMTSLHGTSQTTVFNEDFSGTGSALPAGWTQQTQATDGGWSLGTAGQLSSQAFTIPAFDGRMAGTNDDDCNCDKSNEIIITPVVDLSNLNNAFFSVDVFYRRGTYQGATEDADIRLTTDSGATWTVLKTLTGQTAWRNELIDLSNHLDSNVQIGVRYDDGAGWTFGAAIDNVKFFEAVDYDIAGVDLELYRFIQNNTATILQGRLRNLGGETVTSLTLNYQIDNGAVVSSNLTGLNIAPTDFYDFIHPTPWQPTNDADYNVKFWASNINGNVDQINDNDTLNKLVTVASQLAERKVIYEQFTSNTCGPCASVANNISNFLATNGVNTPNGKMVAIKYHQNFPAPGTDAAYTAESGARRTFYGVGAIPAAVAGGNAYNGHSAGLTQATVDEVHAQPTFIDIDIDYTYDVTAQSFEVEVDVNSFANYNEACRVYIALIEDEVSKDQLGGTTSQQIYQHIFRKMLPNQNGTPINSFTNGQSQSFTFSHTLDTVFDLMSNISVVAFVQNNATKEILQAASLTKVATNVSNNIAEENNIDIFPNPSSNFTNVSFDLEGVKNVNVQIFNAIGQVVENFDLNGVSGKFIHTLNTEKYENGLYILSSRVDGKITSKKFVVSK